MAGTIFEQLSNEAEGRELSVRWYRSKINDLAPRITAGEMLAQGKSTATPNFGLLNLFNYKPLGPERLKYYDMFPLVLPFKFHRNGFTGLNFHYLSIPMRIDLLRRLDAMFEEDAELYRLDSHNQGRVLAMTWSRIKGMRGVKPCVKRYRAMYVYSNFLKIEVHDMAAAVLLPVEKFYEGDLWADKQGRVISRDVWKDSRRETYA